MVEIERPQFARDHDREPGRSGSGNGGQNGLHVMQGYPRQPPLVCWQIGGLIMADPHSACLGYHRRNAYTSGQRSVITQVNVALCGRSAMLLA